MHSDQEFGVTTPCLSVVMPCYNEAPTILEVARRVLASPYTAELIIVDDGSTDGTADLCSTLQSERVRVVTQPRNQGKGAALRRGFSLSTAPFVVVQDADLEYDPHEYGTLLQPLLDDEADVVYGSRFLGGRGHRVLYYWHSVGNRFLTTLSNMATNLNLTDMETCYKAFRREVLESLEIHEDRFGFEAEITAKVARGPWRVYEVGVSYAGRTYAEGKKIGWRDGVRALACIAKYSPVGLHAQSWMSTRPHRAGAAPFHEADRELSSTLDSLDDADRYATWIYGLLQPYLGKRVLEIGAGHGTLTELLRQGRSVVATDLSERCAAVLRERFSGADDVAVLNLPVSDIVGRDETYDSVVLVNVLEHIEQDVDTLAQLRSVLDDDGHILIYAPAFEALYSPFDQQVGHHRRYTIHSLRRRLLNAGLAPVEVRYVNVVGAVVWWAFAARMGRTPTKRWMVRAFDAMVPLIRRVDGSGRVIGQSVFAVAKA